MQQKKFAANTFMVLEIYAVFSGTWATHFYPCNTAWAISKIETQFGQCDLNICNIVMQFRKSTFNQLSSATAL